ncbi:hypothetical protein [Sulfurisphaera javensis]
MDGIRHEQDEKYIRKALEKQPPQLNNKKALGILEYLNGKTYNQIAKHSK